MNLMRLLAAVFLTACGWCVGDGRARQLELRCRSLEQTLQMLHRLQQEISCRRANLGELLCRLQQEADPHQELGQMLLSAHSFQTMAPPGSFSSAEAACLSECLSGLGHANAQSECARLNYYIRRFEEMLQDAREQRSVTAGLDRRLGLAAGAALALLVL